MRVFLPIFLKVTFAIVFLAVVSLVFSGLGASKPDPPPAAQKFLKHIQDDNYEAAVRDFGGNTCRCPAKLGWVSYLIYSSGEEPNLAFLMGQKFELGAIRVKKIESKVVAKTVLDNPEDFEVDIPLKFKEGVYQPYFLPIDLAYGHEISQSELQNYLSNPDKEAWKAISLRLRRGIAAGSIAEPGETIARLKRNDEDENKGENVSAAQLAREMFGEEAGKYSQPTDCGKVRKADGSYFSESELESNLPRLTGLELRLHMVRVDNRHPFTIFHFYLADPVLSVPGRAGEASRQVILKNYQTPLPTR